MKNGMIFSFGIALISAAAHGQVIFNQTFDGAAPSFSSYGAGGADAPITPTVTVVGGVGNPDNAMQISMTTATWSTYYAGQLQEMTVSGNTDPVIGNYTLSFDIRGSKAANVQMAIYSTSDQYFGGTPNMISAGVNFVLGAADTWQTVSYNMGSLAPTGNPTGATWQFGFQINSWEWGGPGQINTLMVDNVKLTMVPEPSSLGLAGLGLFALLARRRRC